MSIVETPIEGFKSKLVYKKAIYPQCTCNLCSRFYWNSLFVGSRASGKTYSCVKLIKHYEENKIVDKDGETTNIRTFLISPTVQQNDIFKVLKSLDDDDIYNDYTDDILLDIIEDIKNVKKEAEERSVYKILYKRFDKMSDSQMDDLTDAELKLLEANDYQRPSQLPKLKFDVPPVNIMIMDDLLGASCFSKKSQSIFCNSLIKSRHLNIAFCILVQNLKAVPKAVRLNCNLFWLGKFANVKTILDDLYPEISSIATEDDFELLYKHATDEPFGSLVIDFTKPKKLAFSKGWDIRLQIV